MLTNNFNDLRNSPTSNLVSKMSTSLNAESRIFSSSAISSELYRSLLSFDTKLIPKNALIQSSTLSIKPTFHYYYSTESNNFITLVEANPSNPQSLTNSDFNKFNSEIIDSTDRILLDGYIGQFLDLPFNDFGLTKINKIGFTNIGLITGRDLLGGTQSDNREDIMFSFTSSNYPQTSFHPNLKVVYTLSPGCGNGVLETPEECDDSGVNANFDQCNESCALTYCGDSVLQTPNGKGLGGILNYGYEECDDGNQIDNDACSNNCVITNNPNTCLNKNKCEDYNSDLVACSNDPCGFGDCNILGDLCRGPSCSNGRLDLNEFCDGGSTSCYNQQGYLGTADCNLQCTNIHTCNPIQSCGDGKINGQEICDDGLSLNGDPLQCNSDCTGQTPASCSNGVLEIGEQCDDGNTNNGDNCRNNCVNNTCGDGYFNYLSEQCDDSNTNNADYCKNDCKINTVCTSTTCTIKIPSVSLDGFIRAESINGNNGGFDNLRALSAGSYVNQYSSLPLMQLRNAQTLTNNNEITRIILPFKTSLIPTTINIQSAKVEIHQSVMSANASPSSLNYIKLAKIDLLAPPNFGMSDYSKFTTLSPISVPIFQGSSGINNLALSELSWINRGGNAWTVLGIRGGYDITGLVPGTDAILQINYHPADGNYATYPTPQLVITFPAGCNNGIIDAGEQCEPIGKKTNCDAGYGAAGTKICNSSCQWGTCVRNPPTSGACFLPDTMISTENGKAMIKDIKEGDVVVSYNEVSNKMESNKVTKVFKHQTESYLIINGKLKVTPNHPIFVNNQWQEIGSANIGDNIRTLNNGEETIFSIKQIKNSVEVFNLQVENNHNYFAEDFLVHNKGPLPPGSDIV